MKLRGLRVSDESSIIPVGSAPAEQKSVDLPLSHSTEDDLSGMWEVMSMSKRRDVMSG